MADPRPTILIVEDEPEIRRFLRAAFGAEGYRVVESATGRRGSIDAGTHKPDLAIVDLGLPDVDGIEVIRRIREWSPMPIIVLSARVQERAKIEALDSGADDYVTKPFGIGELLARVRAALRHAVGRASGRRCCTSGSDRRSRKAPGEPRRRRGATHADRIPAAGSARQAPRHGRDASAAADGSMGADARSDTHYLRIYMKQLREKFEPDPVRPRHLVTETGVGYRLLADD